MKGESVQALLDTESPAMIVSLEFFMPIKKKPHGQSPEDWRHEMEKQHHWPCTFMGVGDSQW
jgi:hypothetical protein